MTVNISKLLQQGERYMGSKANNIGGKTIIIGKVGERGKVLREVVTDAVGNVVKNNPATTATAKAENVLAYLQPIL